MVRIKLEVIRIPTSVTNWLAISISRKCFFWDEKYRFVFSRKNCKKIDNLLIPCPPQFYSPVMPSGLSIRGSQYKCHSTLSVMSSLGRDTIYHQTIGTTKHISNSVHLQSPHVWRRMYVYLRFNKRSMSSSFLIVSLSMTLVMSQWYPLYRNRPEPHLHAHAIPFWRIHDGLAS